MNNKANTLLFLALTLLLIIVVLLVVAYAIDDVKAAGVTIMPTLAPTMDPWATAIPYPWPEPTPMPTMNAVYFPLIRNGATPWELFCEVYPDTNWCVYPETRPLVDDPYWYDPTCTKEN